MLSGAVWLHQFIARRAALGLDLPFGPNAVALNLGPAQPHTEWSPEPGWPPGTPKPPD